jgi:CDP-glucose 4,6-dehydratase
MEWAADLLQRTYEGRRVLVTGHTGFKGSWLALWLAELGAHVAGYALDSRTARDNFVVSRVETRITDIRGDIRDFETLRKAFEEFRPEFVFHLAAQALVLKGYENPRETFDINLGGTVNVLENCRLSGSVKTVVNVTSDKCYENKECSWGYRECDPMGGYDPYSASKGCAELISAAYRTSFFNNAGPRAPEKALATVRAGNVIGGGDWSKDRIVPDCIRFLEAGETIKLRSPGAIRPWQHVLEPLGGYLLLGAMMKKHGHEYDGAWNFGPDRASTITVGELVGLVIAEWGSGSWESTASDSQAHEAGLLTLDINKARYKLGWVPSLDVQGAVKRTVDWYRACGRGADMGLFAQEQIRDYMHRMVIMQLRDKGTPA